MSVRPASDVVRRAARPLLAVAVAAMALAGCRSGGATGTRSPEPRRPMDARPSMPPEPARGEIREQMFLAPSLGVTKHVAVYLPPSYARQPERRFPVVYYLHGLFGAETDWLAKASLDVVADSLFAAGAPEAIVVMPDGDDGWYTTWARQVPYEQCADTLHSESPGRFCVRAQRYDEYVARDLVSFVDGRYRTLADRAHRGVGGLSMGGFGAVKLALQYPEVFGAAASHSGVVSPLYIGPKPFAPPARYAASVDTLRALRTSFLERYELAFGGDVAGWRANDPATLAAALVRRGGPVPALFVDCGREDGLVDQNRAFHWELTRLGIAHEYAEWPGAHTWRYWSTHVPESMAWMLGRVGGGMQNGGNSLNGEKSVNGGSSVNDGNGVTAARRR